MTLTPFANANDVAARWRPLSDSETDVATILCGDASSVIRARFPGIDSQVTSGQLDANVLTIVVAGMVKRAMIAPAEGVTQESETVGPFSHSQTYANPLGNVFLTAADLTLILGYQPPGASFGYANTTTNVENCGPVYVYGDPSGFCTEHDHRAVTTFIDVLANGSTLTVIRGSKNLSSGAWTETSRHTVAPVGVDPTGVSESYGPTGSADQVTADITVYAAFDADIVATDRVLIDGNTAELFDVQGDPQRWTNPRTGLPVGCVVQLVHHGG